MKGEGFRHTTSAAGWTRGYWPQHLHTLFWVQAVEQTEHVCGTTNMTRLGTN